MAVSEPQQNGAKKIKVFINLPSLQAQRLEFNKEISVK